MYHVKVFFGNEAVDERHFEFGTWKEIGFWLDNYGYIDKNYRLEVRFTS